MASDEMENVAGMAVAGRLANRREREEEVEWVLASQGGDRVAFNRLVLRWQQRIYNLSLRMLNDPEDAAEATQEAFLAAFRNIGRFRLDARFSTWLFRIASNKCLTRLRRRPLAARPITGEEGDSLGAGFLQSGADQEGELLEGERRRLVRGALGGLPAEQRIVVELKFYQERTFEEISSICETPLSTVKSRFYSGLQGLKSRLSRDSI